MTKTERVRYEMLLRVRDFGRAHRELFPESSTGAEALAKVAQAAAKIGADATTKQVTATRGREAMAVTRALVVERMKTIARTARGVQKTPGAAGQPLRMPGKRSGVSLTTSARTFLREAEAREEELTRLGLPDTCLAELREAADALEKALGERRSGRLGHAEAQASLKGAMALSAGALRTLDIVVANALENDAALFEVWKGLRRVAKGQSKTVSDAAIKPDTPPTAVGEPTVTDDMLAKAS